MIGEPRVVEAGRGVSWWSGGLRLFKSSVFTWIGIMIIYFLISALISMVPFVGSVGHWLLTPVFMGGLMVGCASLEKGEPLRVKHLFEGFQGPHFVPLMIIGALNMALALGIAAIGAAGALGSLKLAESGLADPMDALTGSLRAMTGAGLLVFLVVVVVLTIFTMLNWFAPALVVLRGATAVEAMKLSFLSCLRNWAPFLVYGLIGMVIAIVAAVIVGALAVAAGIGAFMGASNSGFGALLGFMALFFIVALTLALVAGPVVFGSTYSGYKDTLAFDDAALGNPAYQ
jgi:hypothetical protein